MITPRRLVVIASAAVALLLGTAAVLSSQQQQQSESVGELYGPYVLKDGTRCVVFAGKTIAAIDCEFPKTPGRARDNYEVTE